MTREDIEKAAVEARVASASTLTMFGMQRSLDDIMGLAANISLDDLAESAFVKGADWRINSVWHKASETPAKQIAILAIRSDGSCEKYFFITIMRWKSFVKRCGIIRWAYIEDLLPNEEE